MELVERKEEVRWLWTHFLVSQRRICELMNVAESSQRYVCRKNDEALRAKLVEAAREKPRWGYRRLQLKLEEKGLHVNHKRVYRVYREAGLMIRRRRRKRLLRTGFVRSAVTGANQEWALDFVHYGSLRAATRRTGRGKSHEFRRSWCRMILCAELGASLDPQEFSKVWILFSTIRRCQHFRAE